MQCAFYQRINIFDSVWFCLQTGERRLEAAVQVTALEAVLQETPVVVCPLNTSRASGDQVGAHDLL